MLVDILFLLIAAIIIVPVFQRIGLGSVLGYLTAGLLVGPSLLGLVEYVDEVTHIAELGVVFFLFVIGLELKPQRLWTMRTLVFAMGLSQVIITGAVLSVIVYLFGIELRSSIIIGLGLALSSTAFVLQLLAERGELPTKEGRAAFGILLFQDIAVVPLMLMIQVFSSRSGAVSLDIGLGIAQGLAALLTVIFVGRYAVRPILRHIAVAGNHEVFAATAVLLVIGTGWLMETVGLSMALGAFLAGVLLSDSEFRHQITADVEHFRGLLLGLFFMAVGMTIDLNLFVTQWHIILGMLVGLLSIKIILLYSLARLFQLNHYHSLRTALYLSQAGEFGFILFTIAFQQEILTQQQHSILLLVIATTMIVTPLLFSLARKFTQHYQDEEVPEEMHAAHADVCKDAVLIAGFGRFGEQVAKVLEAGGISYVAIDNNPIVVIKAHAQSLPVYYGDVSQPNVLRYLNADNARLAVVTLDNPNAVEKTINAIHHQCPHVPIFARTHSGEDSEKLHAMGVETTIPETLESSLQLAATILFRLGIKKAHVLELINDFRDEDYRRLREDETEPAGGNT